MASQRQNWLRECILTLKSCCTLPQKSHTKACFWQTSSLFSGSKLPHFNKIGNLVLLKNHVLVPKIRPGFLVWFLLTKTGKFLPAKASSPTLVKPIVGRVFDSLLGINRIHHQICTYMIAKYPHLKDFAPPPTRALLKLGTRPHFIPGASKIQISITGPNSRDNCKVYLSKT